MSPRMPYMSCWWCSRQFTAGGKHARSVMLADGPVLVHVECAPKVVAERPDAGQVTCGPRCECRLHGGQS